MRFAWAELETHSGWADQADTLDLLHTHPQVPKGERFVEQEVKDAESALLQLEREFVEELEGEGQQFGRQIGGFFKSLKGVFAGSPKQAS